MARPLQPAFSSGELSPSLYARVDLARYGTAARKLRNMFVRPHGGVSNRSGTQYVAPARFADQESVLIPFIFSTEQAYILEFSAGAIQVFANGGFVQSTSSIAISNVTIGGGGALKTRTIFTVAPHGRSADEVITIDGVNATGTYDVDGTWVVLSAPTLDSLTIKPVPAIAVSGAYTSGGTLTFAQSIANPYSEDELAQLRFAQSADVLTIVHPDHPQHEFRRLSSTAFSFAQAVYETGPFLAVNTDRSIQVHGSAAFGTVTLTATRDVFTADHIGALFYLEMRDLSKIPPWEAGGFVAGESENALSVMRRSDGKVYRSVTDRTGALNETIRSGGVRPTHDTGVQRDGSGKTVEEHIFEGIDWEYLHSGFGIARITAVAGPTSATATVIRRLPDECVGGATTAQGPWTMTGDGADKTLAIAAATSFNREEYEVTFDGVIQDPALFEVDATTDVLTFFTAPALGVEVSARQLSANNRSDFWALGAWSEDQGYPSVVTYWQDRLVYAASRERPQTVWGSKNGNYIDFGVSVPIVDDDAVDFTMNARQINVIFDLIPLDRLIAMTSAGAWVVTDGQNQVLTPSTVGFKPQSYKGAKGIRSVIIGEEALFVHASGREIRTLGYRYESDKFTGVNLSILANHLLTKRRTVVDMDFAEKPHGLLTVIRADGELLQLTYENEQEVIGWAHSDTRGTFQRVCSIPEDGDNAIYLLVRRSINGETVRFIERLADRDIEDVRDGVFLDCSLTVDGRGDGEVTLTLSGSSFGAGDELTCTADAATFQAARPPDEVELEIVEEDDDGIEHTYRVRCEFVSFSTSTSIAVRALTDVPAQLQDVATTTWGQAFDTFSGFDHLTGETVSIAVDGSVEPDQAVVNGAITLEHAAVVVHVGLPFRSEVELLDITIAGAETVRNVAKSIPHMSLLVQASRGFKVGPDATHLDEIPDREDEDYGVSTTLFGEDPVEVALATRWNKSGRALIRQDAPLPLTLLGVIPTVEFGGSGQ